MDNLDFSAITDDQLLTLLRSILRESIRRSPAVLAASRAACLDEDEKCRIATAAADREAARLRAMERERVAKEATEKVRREKESQDAQVNYYRATEAAQQAKEAGLRAAAEAEAKIEEERQWLRRAAALVEIEPQKLSMVYFKSHYGVRVLINGGGRYAKEHLVDWNADNNTIKTTRALTGKKPDIIAFCAEFRAVWKTRGGQAYFVGPDLTWKEEAACPTS